MEEQRHFKHLSDSLLSLWQDEILLDQTMTFAENKQIHLHKLLLAIFSPDSRPSPIKESRANQVLHYNDIQVEDAEEVITFLYGGQYPSFSSKKVKELLLKLNFNLLVKAPVKNTRASSKPISGKESDEIMQLEHKKLRDLTFEVEMKSLFHSKDLADITIKTCRTEHKCHRVVLATMCSYFRLMFSSGMRESFDNVVKVRGVESKDFSSILCYLYKGKIDINISNAQNLLTSAVYLQMEILQTTCEHFLVNQIDSDNCIDMFMLAKSLGCGHLKDGAWEYVIDNFPKINKCQLLTMDAPDCLSLIQDQNLNTPNEEFLCKFALAWVAKDKKREEMFYNILELLHLTEISSEYLSNILLEHELVKTNKHCQEIVQTAISNNKHLAMMYSSRKEKVFLVVKTSSYVKHVEVGCYSLQKKMWFKLLTSKVDTGCGIASCFSNNICYLSGGTGKNKRVVKIDFEGKCVSPLPKLLQGRSSHSMEMVDSCLYVLGGLGPPGEADQPLSSIEKLVLGDDQWHEVSHLVIAKADSTSAVVDRKIYLLGGSVNPWTFVSEIQCFDTASGQCSVLVHHLPTSVSMARAVVNKTDIYLVCPRGEVIHFRDGSTPRTLGRVHSSSMIGYGVLHHDGSLYVMGGSSTKFESDITYKFDLKTNSVSIFQNIPFLKQSNSYFCTTVYANRSLLCSENEYEGKTKTSKTPR